MQSCLSLRKQLLQNDVIKWDWIRMSRPLLVLMNQLQIFASQQGRKNRQECNHHCAFPFADFLNIQFIFDVKGTQVLFLILSNKLSASLKRRPIEESSLKICGGCQIEILCRVRLLPQWPFSELCSLTSSLICSLVFAFYVYLSSSPAVQHVVR